MLEIRFAEISRTWFDLKLICLIENRGNLITGEQISCKNYIYNCINFTIFFMFYSFRLKNAYQVLVYFQNLLNLSVLYSCLNTFLNILLVRMSEGSWVLELSVSFSPLDRFCKHIFEKLIKNDSLTSEFVRKFLHEPMLEISSDYFSTNHCYVWNDVRSVVLREIILLLHRFVACKWVKRDMYYRNNVYNEVLFCSIYRYLNIFLCDKKTPHSFFRKRKISEIRKLALGLVLHKTVQLFTNYIFFL